jgi:hypothetical protein
MTTYPIHTCFDHVGENVLQILQRFDSELPQITMVSYLKTRWLFITLTWSQGYKTENGNQSQIPKHLIG